VFSPRATSMATHPLLFANVIPGDQQWSINGNAFAD
jgi:hypothetical protein